MRNKILVSNDSITQHLDLEFCLKSSQVGQDCRICRMRLCRWVRPLPNDKPSDSMASVMLDFGEMRGTASLISLPGPLWLRAVVPDRALSMGQIEMFEI